MVELLENDRVVGGHTPAAAESARAFFASFVRGEVLSTSARVAEMVGHATRPLTHISISFRSCLAHISPISHTTELP